MKEFYFKDTYYRKNEWMPGRITLVFVHGVSGSSSAWLPYEKIFEEKYNILTYDIRGHGMSKKFPKYADYKIKNFAEDLYILIAHLHISKFVMISNSFGGLIALEYLKHHADTVVANVFTSPEIYVWEGSMAKTTRPILAGITGIISILPFNPKPRGHVDYKKHLGSTDWNIKRNLADMRNTGLRAHFYTLRHSFEGGQTYEIENIQVPTLVMHGEKDSMVPLKNAFAMSKKIKNSKFASIKNVDHNTAHNAVREISEAIESFIETHKENLL